MLLAVKESAMLTKILTVVNIIFLLFAIICGATKTDTKNWNIQVPSNNTALNDTPCTNVEKIGNGGFLPFGMGGVFTAGAKCFYAYIGIHIIFLNFFILFNDW